MQETISKCYRLVSNKKVKFPVHFVNNTDTSVALEVSSMRYYKMNDVLEPLDL